MAPRFGFLSGAALALCALLLAAQAQTPWPKKPGAEVSMLPADQAFRLLGAERHGEALTVSWDIAPGYYLYRQRLHFEPANALLPELPQGQPYHDEHFGDVEIYRGILQARLRTRGPAQPRQLRVSYQGCADAGVCYPPQTRTLDLAAQP
jgi:thiol:disulfide interchange protein DsbD